MGDAFYRAGKRHLERFLAFDPGFDTGLIVVDLWERTPMGDEHDRAEAMWYEAGCPSLAELSAAERNLGYRRPTSNDDMKRSVAHFQRPDPRPVRGAFACNNFLRSSSSERTCDHCGWYFHEHPRIPTVQDWYKAKQQNKIQEEQVSRREQLAQELAATRAAQARLEDSLAKFAKFPEEDPYVDGDVIVFEKQYRSSERVYRYVAARINGQYFLTGEVTASMNWTKLVEFMNQGGTVHEVWLLEKSRELFSGRAYGHDPNEGTAATVA